MPEDFSLGAISLLERIVNRYMIKLNRNAQMAV